MLYISLCHLYKLRTNVLKNTENKLRRMTNHSHVFAFTCMKSVKSTSSMIPPTINPTAAATVVTAP